MVANNSDPSLNHNTLFRPRNPLPSLHFRTARMWPHGLQLARPRLPGRRLSTRGRHLREDHRAEGRHRDGNSRLSEYDSCHWSHGHSSRPVRRLSWRSSGSAPGQLREQLDQGVRHLSPVLRRCHLLLLLLRLSMQQCFSRVLRVLHCDRHPGQSTDGGVEILRRESEVA